MLGYYKTPRRRPQTLALLLTARGKATLPAIGPPSLFLTVGKERGVHSVRKIARKSDRSVVLSHANDLLWHGCAIINHLADGPFPSCEPHHKKTTKPRRTAWPLFQMFQKA